MQTSLITWNVNSIRQRINQFNHLINDFKPDIILLQEIKCENTVFPNESIDNSVYKCIINGQKSYNGTAIITKFEVDEINNNLPGFNDKSSRYQEISVEFTQNKKIKIINIYAPQGQELSSPAFENKMQFYDCLYEHLKMLIKNEETIILAGDYNIAYEPIDVYDANLMKDKIGFHTIEREKLRKIYNLDMIDAFRLINKNIKSFTWWDYRQMGFEQNKGMRIDNILISPNLVDTLTGCEIIQKFRKMDKPSDHAPVIIYFDNK